LREKNKVCIAIYKPERINIYNEVFQDCFAWHSDGAGFMVHDPHTNSLIMKKGFFTLKSFLKAFEPYRYHKAVIHFRMATHGKTDAPNCHPFMVSDTLGFVHNGMLQNVKEWDKNFSDTWHFNEAIMKKLYESFGVNIAHHRTVRFLIERFIGRNKLIFMDNEGKATIYNEDLGQWDSGCWFSNDTYQYTPQHVSEFLGYDSEALGTEADNIEQAEIIHHDSSATSAAVRAAHAACGCDANVADVVEALQEAAESEEELNALDAVQ
jgi:hypothetical protein